MDAPAPAFRAKKSAHTPGGDLSFRGGRDRACRACMPAGILPKKTPGGLAARQGFASQLPFLKYKGRPWRESGPRAEAFPKSRTPRGASERRGLSGVAGGGWKGVLRGAASPKQHPPSPVRRTNSLEKATLAGEREGLGERKEKPGLSPGTDLPGQPALHPTYFSHISSPGSS